MLTYCQLDPLKQIYVKFQTKYKKFIQSILFQNVVCEMGTIMSRVRWVNQNRFNSFYSEITIVGVKYISP